MVVQFTTTTLFTTPTPSHTGSQVHPLSSISIGAIVGGTIAGSALAVLVVVTWIYWGKQIQKTKRKQEEELVCGSYSKKWDSPLIMIATIVTGQEPQDEIQHATQCADQYAKDS